MSRSSALTSQQSVVRPRLAILEAAERQDRRAAVGFLALALSWLAYTRFYFFLHPRHLTFDPSLFMYFTGKPDPACGLTRTFAWMWRGDLAHAVAVYPLGPIIFIATFVLVGYWVMVLVGGRSVRFTLSPSVQSGIVIVALVAFGLNWASKLIWLGM